MTTISSIEDRKSGAPMAPDREFSADAKTFLSQTLTDQIHLVSIAPDGLAKGKDFGTDVEAALSWAQRQSDRGKNIYWAVNPTELAASLPLRPITTQVQNSTTVVTSIYGGARRPPPVPLGGCFCPKENNPMNTPRLLRASEAAALLNVSHKTLAGWRAKGIGPVAYRLSSSAIRYSVEELDAFINAGRSDRGNS